MASAAQRMYYAMLGGGAALVPSGPGECDPYTMPPPTAANINLTEALVLAASTAANTNLCEELI
jgi:hypothetical protein